MTHHGETPHLTSVHAQKQVPEVMGLAHHEDSADFCATDVKEIAYTSIMELVLAHYKSRCICYQYSYMTVERTIPSWPNNYRQAEFVLNNYHMHST